MKISLIAAQLHKIAYDSELLTERQGNFDYPDELVPKFVAVAFTDSDAVESFTLRPVKEKISQARKS